MIRFFYLKEEAEEDKRKEEHKKMKELKNFIKTTDSIIIRKSTQAIDTPIRGIRGGENTPHLQNVEECLFPRDFGK